MEKSHPRTIHGIVAAYVLSKYYPALFTHLKDTNLADK